MNFDSYDNRNNLKLESEVPSICKEEDVVMGIDEAGRGPVLGPMVYGACYCPATKTEILKNIGFADSKTLSEEQRDNLFVKLNEEENLGWMVDILSPNYISNCMLRRSKYNLNTISHDTAIGLISKSLELGVKLTEVYLDTVGDPNSYQAKLQKLFPLLKVVVSKKADSIYPVVSAASICAKISRDRVLKEWGFREGGMFNDIQYGSGYPGDPKTKAFLSEHMDKVFGFPQLVRFSWSTASNILNNKAVPVVWEDDDDEDDNQSWKAKSKQNDQNVTAISTFFRPSDSSESRANRSGFRAHRYFLERNLSRVDGF